MFKLRKCKKNLKDRVHVTAKKRRKKKLYSKLSIITNQYNNSMYYYNFIAVSAHGQLKANLLFWLATRVGKLFEIAALISRKQKITFISLSKFFFFWQWRRWSRKKRQKTVLSKQRKWKRLLWVNIVLLTQCTFLPGYRNKQIILDS